MPNTGMASPTMRSHTIVAWSGRLVLAAFWAALTAKMATSGIGVWGFTHQGAIHVCGTAVVISAKRRIVANVKPNGVATVKSIPRGQAGRRVASIAEANNPEIRELMHTIGRICCDNLPVVDSATGTNKAFVRIRPDGNGGLEIKVGNLPAHTNSEGHEVKHGPSVRLLTIPYDRVVWEKAIGLACRHAQLQVLRQKQAGADRTQRAEAAVRAAQLELLRRTFPSVSENV